MAGAYCKFCSTRCFVERVIPDGPEKGWTGHMATCPGGMGHDLKVLGHTYLTAVNPVTEPEAAADIAAEMREGALEKPRPISSAHGRWTLTGYDEKGFACLDEECPGCSSRALIINEEDEAECLACSWREEQSVAECGHAQP